ERHLAKVEVASPSLVARSIKQLLAQSGGELFFYWGVFIFAAVCDRIKFSIGYTLPIPFHTNHFVNLEKEPS
ncbi:MAG: hypothetical protein RR288_07150, partial [Oscillibacter sp.]